ncbi:MAG: cobalamin-independent methionine synthase II family protein [Methyloligellaceae bacterium]
MKRSTDRILTTHTGSLPRPPKLVELLQVQMAQPDSSHEELDSSITDAINDVVSRQCAAGLDIINDGEQGRKDYTVHVMDRLNGFKGEIAPPLGTGDPEFPELAELLSEFSSPFQIRPACNGPISWKDWPAVGKEIDRAKTALSPVKSEDMFMTCPSPGQIARYLKNQYYGDDETYLFTLAEIMSRNYEAIAAAGFILQLDCPDLAMCRHTIYPDIPIEDYRKIIRTHVEALNLSLKNIPAEQTRMHVCWGSTMGPHHTDVPFREIVDIVLMAKPMAVSFPAANPRHGHEWKIWKDVKLPDGKILIPGVIDSTSNFVEHPELVADRILQYCDCVGSENVIAGVDCGFGTFAGRVQVDRNIVWMKLSSLVEGAELASHVMKQT